MTMWMALVLGAYGVMSVTTVVAYGWDKRAAVRGGRRVPEATLHVLALVGGIAGALAGQQLFRHKRRKAGFMAVTGLIALGHLGLWGWLAWRTAFAGN